MSNYWGFVFLFVFAVHAEESFLVTPVKKEVRNIQQNYIEEVSDLVRGLADLISQSAQLQTISCDSIEKATDDILTRKQVTQAREAIFGLTEEIEKIREKVKQARTDLATSCNTGTIKHK